MLNFKTTQHEEYRGNPFISVELAYPETNGYIKGLLERLEGVRLVNLSRNDKCGLIVYPNIDWSLDDVEREVKSVLSFATSDAALRSEFSTIQLKALDKYTDVKKHLDKGIKFIKEADEYRMGLDEMRLALELLCKKIFLNEKSLEHQIPFLKDYLSRKGYDNPFSNLIISFIKSYTSYNNNDVKHASGDGITPQSADVSMSLIVTLIKALI